MLLSLTLPISFLLLHIYARVLLRPSLALTDLPTSKAIERDLDTVAQNEAQSCSTYSSLGKRGMSPTDGAANYDFSAAGAQLMESRDQLGIQDSALALNTLQPTQPLTSGLESNSPDNQPIELNNIFDNQNKATDFPAKNSQLLSLEFQNPSENTATDFLSNSVLANPSGASTENIALGNLGENNPSDSPDDTVNNGLVAAISPALPFNFVDGAPEFDCVNPDKGDPLQSYTVWEFVYQGETSPVWRWPHAILAAEGFASRSPYRRYTVFRGSDNQGLYFHKDDPFSFLQPGVIDGAPVTKIIEVSKLRRRGWLIAGDGEPKENALAWFEGMAGITKKPALPTIQRYSRKVPQMHFTEVWAKLFIEDLNLSGSKYWIGMPWEKM